MSYQSAIAKIYALGHELAHTPSHKFDLTHMRAMLSELNHPECRFPGVLIASIGIADRVIHISAFNKNQRADSLERRADQR